MVGDGTLSGLVRRFLPVPILAAAVLSGVSAGPAAAAPVAPVAAFAAMSEPPDPPPLGVVEAPREVRRAAALRRGIRFTVSGQQRGKARVVGTLALSGRVVARATRTLRARRKTTIDARLTAYGRRLVRRSPSFLVSLSVRLPGEPDPHVNAVRIRG